MLKTKTTTFLTLSRPPMAPLNIADIYTLRKKNIIPFETKPILNATANPFQTLYQPFTAHIMNPSPFLFLSYSTLNPNNPSSINTQIYTICFVEMNKSEKTFDGLDHQCTPEKISFNF